MSIETDRTDDWPLFTGLPGHPMMWVLILSEFAVFGIMLVVASVTRLRHAEAFDAGQAALDPRLGALNTLVLVTGGWLAARATAAAHEHAAGRARLNLLGAVATGLVFVAVKTFEYSQEIDAGLGLETSPFFTLYFLLTAFHALHVVLGAIILAVVAWSAEAKAVETGAAFWHMVDLVWIVMFPVLYLVH